MQNVNEYLKTAPFDIYELHLFQLVAQHRSFTKAAQVAGLTQSAVTRQVQGIEKSLGVGLLERTTRSVRLTAAGEALFAESERLIGSVDEVLQRIREEFTGAKKEIRVGVSRSVGLAYLPGFFHANIRRQPQIGYRVSYQGSADVISALETNRIDVGVLCPPPRLPKTVRVTHKFADAFTIVAPADGVPSTGLTTRRAQIAWASSQNWLLLDEESNTGGRLRKWLASCGMTADPTMQLDSFDLLISLVALGMGASCVPIRALALYGRKRNVRRVSWSPRFTRELVVIVRRHRQVPEHLAQFIGNILF
jgi:DNA-binding transcriptional LysR family regulator